MRKRSIKEKINRLPTATDWIRKEEKKDKSFKVTMDRLRLRIAIVKAIKAARQQANISQAALAQALGVSQAQIGRLESLKDKRLPEIDILYKVSKATRKKIKVHQDDFDLELVAK